MTRVSRSLGILLGIALALRLVFGLAQDPLQPYTTASSDSRFYLGNAYALVVGHSPEGMTTDVSLLTSPPLYFLVIGVPQALLDPAAAVIAVRVLQALLSTATCFFAYALAVRVTGRERAGLIVAGVLAVSPVFIVEAAQILTETLFIFLVAGGVWLYVEAIARRNMSNGALRATHASPLPTRTGIGLLVGAGVLFGLAALTRAVFLAFPFALALHLLLVCGWRAGWRRAALLLIVYALVVSTWTIYCVARWNRFVIAGEGLPAFLYLGTTGWTSPQEVDQQLAADAGAGNYVGGAQQVISAAPLDWIKRRVGELGGAYLQPHGTTFFAGESLRDLLVKWVQSDRSLGGLGAIARGDWFWIKLALYILHYGGLIGGVIGMGLYRHRWRIALPLVGFILYLTLIHFVLYALPRYLFPTEIFWWVFAAAALDRLIGRAARWRPAV